MKTVIIHPENASRMFNHDEFDSFRSEGRYPVNIGFGLSQLGYDVNIAWDGWTSIQGYKTTWNNIKLSPRPLQEYYDIALLFTGPSHIKKTKFGIGIYMGYQSEHIIYAKNFKDETGIQLRFACPFKGNLDSVRSQAPFPVYYLPPLFPIPSINVGYLSCAFTPQDVVRVYMHHSSWPSNLTMTGNQFLHKQQLALNYLRDIGAKVHLTVHILDRDAANNFPISHPNMTFFYSNEHSYLDVINLIRSSNLCITLGGPVTIGNGLCDIISLGRPLIYIADLRPHEWGKSFGNPLYNSPDSILFIQESDEESTSKMQKIIVNPVGYCQKFADLFRDHDFNTWKDIVKNVFD